MAGHRAKITLLRYQTLLKSELYSLVNHASQQSLIHETKSEQLVATNSEVTRSVSSVFGLLDIPQVALAPYQVHIRTPA